MRCRPRGAVTVVCKSASAVEVIGMRRLISYISRCPFLLLRMIKVAEEGGVIWLAGKSEYARFPQPGVELLVEGVLRNFLAFDVLEFLAQVTQHIPGEGQHLIQYIGWHSNGGKWKKREPIVPEVMNEGEGTCDAAFMQQRRLSWAVLVRKVY